VIFKKIIKFIQKGAISLMALFLSIQFIQADQMPLNQKLSDLLRNYYAFALGHEEFVDHLIGTIEKDNDLINQESVENELKKFNNLHLYVVKNKDTKKHSKECVSLEQGELKISSFWCEDDEKNNRSAIKNRFAQSYITSLEKSLKQLSINDSNQLIIDLRGNGGGGDEEMELALFPFINKGDYLYDYQFKFLTSPHFFPRLITRMTDLIGGKEMISRYWDKRRSYYFNFKNEQWSPDIIKKLRKLKEEVDNRKLEIQMIVDSQTGSASELFASILVDKQKASLKGTQTKGSAGAPTHYTLLEANDEQDSIVIAIPAVRIWRINGEVIEGMGLKP